MYRKRKQGGLILAAIGNELTSVFLDGFGLPVQTSFK
jgi:hypothetical protein